MNQSAKELQKIRKQESKVVLTSKRITRRKALMSENVSSKQMQKYNSPIEISFD